MRAPGTGAVARLVLALAGAVVLGLAAPAAHAAPAASSASVSPSGSATVRGVLLLGDPAVPVGGAKVSLHGAADGADPLTLTATTDAKGRFVFGSLAGGDAWVYTVTAENAGTQFSTDAISVKAGETVTTTLRTWPVTTDPAAVSWPEWLVWLDVQGSTLAVQQDVSMRNTGTKAYTGSTPVQGAPDGGKAAVELPVAPGATSLSYLGAFEVCCDAVSGTTWAHTRPVPPGTTTGTVRYEAPLPGTLAFPVTTATQSFTMLVPEGTQVTSDRLTASGTETDRGVTYQVLKGGPFTAGTTVTVTLGGGAAGASSTPVGIVVGVVVLLVALGLLAWWLLRRRSAAQPTARPQRGPAKARAAATAVPKGRAPSPRAATTTASRPAPTKRAAPTPSKPSAAAAATAATATSSRPADDPDVLADELAMLDLAHESGSLPDEESYQRVRAALVERLVAALGDDPDALSR